eukprot:g31609.t1
MRSTRGYYGQLYSGDDFYALSSGLTVQETTNSLYNKSTAALIQPECVMIAKMSEFKEKEDLPDGFLTVLEQMPGTIMWEDVTHILRAQGFWVSYNSPFFQKIREIFARDVGRATDFATVQHLLRYNDWQHDPLSAHGYEGPKEPNAPENAIAARYDLHPWPQVRKPFGNTDAKLCRAAECLQLRFSAVSGPTADQQAPFEWTGQWHSSPHLGHPLRWTLAGGWRRGCVLTACCAAGPEGNLPQRRMLEGRRLWCSVEQPLCQGADWGFCDSDEDPILAGSFPVCVRVIPSNATSFYEYEPCQHRFTYVRQPHVDSISPRTGPSTGGTNVTLYGRYFPQARLGGLLCRFGPAAKGTKIHTSQRSDVNERSGVAHVSQVKVVQAL